MRGSAELSYINFFQRFYRRTLRRLLRRWFWRKHRHVTVRIYHFKSLGESVGNVNGEPVTSLYGHCTSSHFESIGKKNNPPKPPRQRPAFFLNSETFPSVIQLVNTEGKFPSVFTDWITDGKVCVGFYRLNYGRKVAVGNFDLKIPTKNIPSINPLVFSEFLVVIRLPFSFMCYQFWWAYKALNAHKK
jgi:hypothetical protein